MTPEETAKQVAADIAAKQAADDAAAKKPGDGTPQITMGDVQAAIIAALKAHGAQKPEKKTDAKGKQEEGGSELDAMRKTLEQMQQSAEADRDRRASSDRDASLRKIIESASVVDIEGAFRFMRPDMHIGDSGEFYAKGANGEYVTVDKHVRETVRANKWLQAQSTRGGGGGGGSPMPHGSSKSITMDQYKAELTKLQGDDNAVAKYLADVLGGRIAVQD